MEGISEIAALIREKGPKNVITTILIIMICAVFLLGAFKSSGLLAEFKERDVIFCGSVFNKAGERLQGVRVLLEGFPNSSQYTDSEGKFALTVKNTELKNAFVTLIFETPKGDRITRRQKWNEGFVSQIEILVP